MELPASHRQERHSAGCTRERRLKDAMAHPHPQPRPFGTLLRQHRILAGLTQEALAERAGLSRRAISDLERGVNQTPQSATLDLLAEALELSAGERVEFRAAARWEKLERRPTPLPLATRPL